MKRPLSGRAWFEAQGRRAASTGLPRTPLSQMWRNWPAWARDAWSQGWADQQGFRP
ncbi:hypothetical protein LJR066_002796 [Acidovorax sp. LjRoot66]|uniref:hypothetical protein n=1 Tax=Acidovorax sp. LjRoot66 TaxID=3342334 RepID=UPI003ECE2DEA